MDVVLPHEYYVKFLDLVFKHKLTGFRAGVVPLHNTVSEEFEKIIILLICAHGDEKQPTVCSQFVK